MMPTSMSSVSDREEAGDVEEKRVAEAAACRAAISERATVLCWIRPVGDTETAGMSNGDVHVSSSF